MAKNVTFQLDLAGGAEVLQNMAAPLIRQSAQAVGSRAQSMAGSISSNAPTINVSTEVGVIKRGQRAIGTVSANPVNARQRYVAIEALKKSLDAGKV